MNNDIAELLKKQDRREVKKQNATNAVMVLYGLFFLGILAIIISIATS